MRKSQLTSGPLQDYTIKKNWELYENLNNFG